MPGAVVKSDPQGASLSFANNFWGKDDAGVAPMLERMHNAKVCCDELKTFYNIRAAIEDEYARKLLALSRKPLGSRETGSLRSSLNTVKAETEALGKTHGAIAAQMKSELEEPLAAFAGGMKERRKIVQNGIEKLLKTKVQQTQAVNKTRDRFEQDCLKIKGYLAQGHMVMGQEERKNKAKLEKTQAQLTNNSHEYENAVRTLEETSGKWIKEWKVACDKFQDLEEERLDFTKSCLWNYANITSTACVSDDASCEKIRVALESCEVEKDITFFIKEKGTGHEIPDPPKFINFCQGDSMTDDTSSIADSEADPGYQVAQFHRPGPKLIKDDDTDAIIGPSASELSTGSGSPTKRGPADSAVSRRDVRRAGRAPPARPGAAGGSRVQPAGHAPAPLDVRRPRQSTADGVDSPIDKGDTSPSKRSPVNTIPSPTPYQAYTPKSSSSAPPSKAPLSTNVETKQPPVESQRKGIFGSNSPFHRRGRNDGGSGSANSPVSGRSPWNRPPPPGTRPSQGHSPITARHDRHRSAPVPPGGSPNIDVNVGRAVGASTPNEPVDPRANFQLNIGDNVFDVASPDQQQQQQPQSAGPTPGDPAVDPIAQALADLKGLGNGSNVSSNSASAAVNPNGSASTANPALGTGSAVSRVSADQYVGTGPTPVAGAPPAAAAAGIVAPAPLATSGTGHRDTPPPAYDAAPSSVSAPLVHAQPAAPVRRLDAPQPAFTSAQMQRTTQQYAGRTQGVFSRPLVAGSGGASGGGAPRGSSPAPLQRSSRRDASPGQASTRSGTSRRSISPGPTSAQVAAYQSSSTNSRHRYQNSVPSTMQAGANGAEPARSSSYSPLPRRSQQGQRYSRHASPGPPPRSAAPPSPRAYASRSGGPSPAGGPPPGAGAPGMSPRVHPSQHSPRPSYARPPSQQVARHDSGAAASAYSRPGTRQSAYHPYDGRDPSPQPGAGTAGYRPSSSSGMELQLSTRVRGGAGDRDGYSEYGGAIPGAPVDEGYGSQRSYPYGSSSDVRSISRGSNYNGAGGSARGRERSRSLMRAGSSSDGRPILHYARALYPYVPAIPEEIGFARNDVLAILMHQDDGWWFAELPDKPGYQGLVPSNYLAPLN